MLHLASKVYRDAIIVEWSELARSISWGGWMGVAQSAYMYVAAPVTNRMELVEICQTHSRQEILVFREMALCAIYII